MSGRMGLTAARIIVLRHVAEQSRINPVTGRRNDVDLRKISEPMRQYIIDLGMMEPALVDVDADAVTITPAGRSALSPKGRSG